LPGLRVRAFVRDDAGLFREVAMSLGTLFVDADKEQVTLIWRGIDEVRETDLADVKSILLVSEKLREPPGSIESHRASLEAFERDPIGLERAPEPAPANGDGLDPISALLTEKLGPRALDEDTRPVLKDAVSRLPKGIDLRAKLAEVTAAAEDTPPVPVIPKP